MSDNQISQIVPFNADAEASLIGAAIIDSGVYDVVGVEPGQFYVERYRIIWDAIGELLKKGMPVDFVTLSDRLEERGELNIVGGPAEMARLIGSCITTLNAEGYAKIVKRCARRRIVLQVASNLARSVYEQEDSMDRDIESAVNELLAGNSLDASAKPVSQYVSDVFDVVNARYLDPREIWGMPTGFADYDALMGGIHKKETTIFSGPPGVGKSMLVLEMAKNLAQQNYAGAIFNLDMAGSALMMRGISSVGEISTRRLKTGKMDDEAWSAFCKACDVYSKLPIYLWNQPINVIQLRAELFRLKVRHNIQWFVLDYLLKLSGHENLEETARSTVLSMAVSRIVSDLDIAGLIVNSTTKAGIDSKQTSMTDSRGSASTLHEADNIVIIKAGEDDSILELHFEKTRDLAKLIAGPPVVQLFKHRTYPAVKNLRRQGTAVGIDYTDR